MAKRKKNIEKPKRETTGTRGPDFKKIDWEKVDSLAFIQCTIEEIAGVLDIDADTLATACKRVHKMKLSEYIAKKATGGKASLRRRQYTKAVTEGNPTLLIWLGKQWLGQTDKVEHNGDEEHPLTLAYKVLEGKSE
jgi:hypothetical protein